MKKNVVSRHDPSLMNAFARFLYKVLRPNEELWKAHKDN